MAYTVLDITTSVQDDLHDSSFSTTRILRYLNAGQRLIFNTHAFPFTENNTDSTLTTGDYTYTPGGLYQANIGFSLTDPVNTDQHHAYKLDNYLPHREFFDRHPVPANNDQALPQDWTEYGGVIFFSCPLDQDYDLAHRYYVIPTELATDSDVPEVPVAFRELLELYVLYRAEKYRGNHDIAATYKQQFDEELEAMTLRYIPAGEVGFHQMTPSRTRSDDVAW